MQKAMPIATVGERGHSCRMPKRRIAACLDSGNVIRISHVDFNGVLFIGIVGTLGNVMSYSRGELRSAHADSLIN